VISEAVANVYAARHTNVPISDLRRSLKNLALKWGGFP
jgi:hypothetical protein